MKAPAPKPPRRAAAVLLAIGLMAGASFGFEISFGFTAGPRTLRDDALQGVYGNGSVYFPHVLVPVWKFLFIGAGYEAGFSRSGLLGLYAEPATLKVSGGEVFGGFRVRFNPITAYARAGYGRFAYKQTVESPIASDYPVDGVKGALVVAGGARIEVLDRLYLSGELKWVPLKVSPYGNPVDLGGMRYLFGIGYTFNL